MTVKLSTAIEAYLSAREADGYAANTIRNNRKDLAKMLDAVGDMKVANVTALHLDRVFAANTHLSAGSLNNLQASIAAFVAWCRARGYMRPDANPLAGRRYRRTQSRERRRLHLGQFERLLDAADHPRDRVVLALGLYLFLRQSEIRDLRVGDVDLDAGEISVRVYKTRDSDTMPIPAELDAELRSWLTYYAAEQGDLRHDWYLCPAKRSPGFGPGRTRLPETLKPDKPMVKIEDIAKRAMNKIGFSTRTAAGKSEWEGMHTLRRSGARALANQLMDDGYDGALRTVQSMLHHANLSMTERYLGLEIDKERRNTLLRGQRMFPQGGGNVVRLAERRQA